METQKSTSTAARLDRTLHKLQRIVQEQEAELEKLRASTASINTEQPSEDASTHIQQLRALTKVYESLTPTIPFLPALDSPLPALLAIRGTNNCIQETRTCITAKEAELQDLQKRLEKEQADLKDAKLIATGLTARINTIEQELTERAPKTTEQVAKEQIRELKKKRQHYDSETGKLVRAFNNFIDDYLAPMLAAEELGGPIVGDVLDIDDEMLNAGFSAKGKLRRSRRSWSEDTRQRRIDEIWGVKPAAEKRDEKEEAGSEMRELTEELLNSVVEGEGTGPGVYVDLKRESAAARFLVRSKVAQFHPKDATKLRLIDFGGEVDD